MLRAINSETRLNGLRCAEMLEPVLSDAAADYVKRAQSKLKMEQGE
jgi:hypothetical protein